MDLIDKWCPKTFNDTALSFLKGMSWISSCRTLLYLEIKSNLNHLGNGRTQHFEAGRTSTTLLRRLMRNLRTLVLTRLSKKKVETTQCCHKAVLLDRISKLHLAPSN
jgi:hypothetical protein